MSDNTEEISRKDVVAVDEQSQQSQQNVVDQVQTPPAPVQQPIPPPGAGESFMAITKSLVIRAVIIYFITSFFRKSQQPAAGPEGSTSVSDPTTGRIPAVNLISDGTVLDLYVFVSNSELFENFNDPDALVWLKEDLVYGDWTGGHHEDGTYTHSVSLPASEQVRNNGSIYVHTYLVKSGFSPDPKSGDGLYNKKWIMYASQRLNKYKRRKYRITSNLITGETALSKEEVQKAAVMDSEIISHWHPNLTINVVHDFTAWTRGSVPPPLDEYIQFLPAGEKYKPITFLNTYWNLIKDYRPINKTTQELELSLTFQPLTLFKWQLYAAQAMKSKFPGAFMLEGLSGEEGEGEEDQDALKEAFLDTSPYLLGLTLIVSILHSVFEFLAFKNDIQFWNNRQSMEGLSVRSVFFNVFQSVIILLYVLDNETNFVIKVSCFIGLGIELWKITKVMDVSINRMNRVLGLPTLKFTDKSTYSQSKTKEYDQLAFQYLSWALFPLMGGYCIYSVLYQEHKGWYSFVLSMFYGFLLTFGFIMMTPQLFINYKMKSVAHLPWRMLTYKALNTFIDDIFAFVIKMPTLYRLGCFRDDIVFFIFLYQRYMYSVDPSRVNEFGFSKEMEQVAKDGKSAVANGSSPLSIQAEAEPISLKTDEEKKKD